MDPIEEINIKFGYEDIRVLKPEWDDEKCKKFLNYVRAELVSACEFAGNDVIAFVLGLKEE